MPAPPIPRVVSRYELAVEMPIDSVAMLSYTILGAAGNSKAVEFGVGQTEGRKETPKGYSLRLLFREMGLVL